jgi:hypothetical protein
MRENILAWICVITLFTGCVTDDGAKDPTPTTQVAEEPGEKPVRLTELGLKVGKIYQIGSAKTWQKDPWFTDAQLCLDSDVEGKECDRAGVLCKKGNISLVCTEQVKMKSFGWVYEHDPVSGKYKPLKDAKVDIWHMALCMVGICNPLAGPVLTNEFGYYEIYANGAIPIGANVRAWKDGFYGVCGSDNQPSCIGGKCSTGDTYKHDTNQIRPIPLKLIKPESCK